MTGGLQASSSGPQIVKIELSPSPSLAAPIDMATPEPNPSVAATPAAVATSRDSSPVGYFPNLSLAYGTLASSLHRLKSSRLVGGGSLVAMAQNAALQKQLRGPFAFVTVLFGTSYGYCIEAAVLGESLRATGTKHALLLLHTADVPSEWLCMLQAVGWQLRQVEYLEGKGLYTGGKTGRFAHVFTKLRVFLLTEFEKIVLLDTDLLVRRNMDCLFLRAAPAALRRHAAADFPDGKRINGAEFYDATGNQSSGINAGVMILEPSARDFEIMSREIQDEWHPEHHESRMPEQDYLTRFYVDRWHALGVQYNYQVHQIAFTDRGGLEQCPRLALDYEEVSVVHFSACPKPRDLLTEPAYAGLSKTSFADQVLCKAYLEGMSQDRRGRGGASGRGAAAIEAQLRSVTWCAALEWFQAWDRLVERLPEIAQLAARARPASVASLPDRAADNDKADETPVSELEGHPPEVQKLLLDNSESEPADAAAKKLPETPPTYWKRKWSCKMPPKKVLPFELPTCPVPSHGWLRQMDEDEDEDEEEEEEEDDDMGDEDEDDEEYVYESQLEHHVNVCPDPAEMSPDSTAAKIEEAAGRVSARAPDK
ncbi:unnamed protein product, partial [Polarella glacialis]